jgi:hypothetical protein
LALIIIITLTSTLPLRTEKSEVGTFSTNTINILTTGRAVDAIKYGLGKRFKV